MSVIFVRYCGEFVVTVIVITEIVITEIVITEFDCIKVKKTYLTTKNLI